MLMHIRARPAIPVESCEQVPSIATPPPRKAACAGARCGATNWHALPVLPTAGSAAKCSKRKQRRYKPCGVKAQLFFDVTAKKE
jgi:hypothetical protein